MVIINTKCSGRDKCGCSTEGFKGCLIRVQQVRMCGSQWPDDAVKIILKMLPVGSSCMNYPLFQSPPTTPLPLPPLSGWVFTTLISKRCRDGMPMLCTSSRFTLQYPSGPTDYCVTALMNSACGVAPSFRRCKDLWKAIVAMWSICSKFRSGKFAR